MEQSIAGQARESVSPTVENKSVCVQRENEPNVCLVQSLWRRDEHQKVHGLSNRIVNIASAENELEIGLRRWFF